MEYILVIAGFQAILLAALVLGRKEKAHADIFLSLLFLAFAATTLLAFMEIYNRRNDYPFPFFIHTSAPFIFLHSPLLWLYIKSLTTQNFRFLPVYLLHFLPFLAILFRFATSVYILPADDRIVNDSTGAFLNEPFYPFVMASILLYTQGYFIWCLLMIKSFRRKLYSFFSRTEQIDLKWLRFFLTASVIAYASISLIYISNFFLNFLPYSTMQPVGYSFSAIFILVLGFYGLRQTNVFAAGNLPLNLDIASQTTRIELPLEKGEEQFVKRLLKLMAEVKPHLNPDLTLATLAAEMNSTPEYLSGILNNRLKRNFFDFVNYYRVEEFKTRCRDPKNKSLSILGIAMDSGFNSKATFNRVFRNMVNLTPGEYFRQVSEK